MNRSSLGSAVVCRESTMMSLPSVIERRSTKPTPARSIWIPSSICAVVATLAITACGGSSPPAAPSVAQPRAAATATTFGSFGIASQPAPAGSGDEFARCLQGAGGAHCVSATRLRTTALSGAAATGAPINLSATAIGSAVTLTWVAPTSGDAVLSYIIEAGSTPGAANLASFSTGNTATSFFAAGVGTGTYFVRVHAVGANSIGASSNEAVLVVTGAGGAVVPGAPSGLGVVGNSGGTVVLTWIGAGGNPTSYVVEAGSGPGLSNLANSDVGLTNTLTANGVGAGTYYVRMRAKNTAGTGAPSNEIVLVVGSDQALTIAAVAPSLAQELNRSFAAALRAGLGIASLETARPQTVFASLFRLLLPTPVYAQAFGGFAPCRNGGNVTISGGATPSGRRVSFSNARATYFGCSYPLPVNNRLVTYAGALTLSGTWSADDANNPVTMAGSLGVNEIGPVEVSCTSLSTEPGCNGVVGGITTGNPDTPPSPNPDSCPATVSPAAFNVGSGEGVYTVTVTLASVCPWTAASKTGFLTASATRKGSGSVTFGVAANSGASRTGLLSIAGQTVTVNQQGQNTAPTPTPALALTGTWTTVKTNWFPSGDTVTLVQTGSNITGTAVGATYGATVISDLITGTIAENTVRLTEVARSMSSSTISGVVVTNTCTDTFVETLAATNTTMSGTYTCTGFCVSSRDGRTTVLPSDVGNISFTRR